MISVSSMRSREWFNENSYRAFPFVENASRACLGGSNMPEWLVVDAKGVLCTFETNTDIAKTGVFLTSYSIKGGSKTTLNFVFQTVLVSGIVRSVATSVTTDILPGRFGRATVTAPSNNGIFRFASVNLVLGAPVHTDGDTTEKAFVLATPRPLCPSRLIVYPGGFGVDEVRGNDPSTALSGEILLKNGHNTTLRVRDNRILLGISATAGLGFECPDSDEKCDAIYRINGQRADSNGMFSISGGEGIRVSSGKYNGIPAVIVQTTSLVDSYAGTG